MIVFLGKIINNILVLENDELTHAIKVLRNKVGDKIFVTDGNGNLFEGEIFEISKKKAAISVISKKYFNSSNNLHVAIAPTKNISRFEFFLEKATEIGINEITPLICENSERKIIKTDRLKKILVSAMKQSKNYHLPKLNNITSYQDFITNCNAAVKLIAHCNKEYDKVNIKGLQNQNTIVLIGPEGDFSESEINLALTNNYTPVTLGNSRLRTETAGIVATTLYNLNI